ncbi:preprotein translocase subunit SecD [Methanosarcinales archaeon]|nr:MAG: preprotein translocase subunit SecD [Methanosarcinales archaeon]
MAKKSKKPKSTKSVSRPPALSKDSLLMDFRVLALILAVVISIILIHPSYSDGELKTNLHYGLDLVGGSTLQLKVEGVIVGVNASKEKVVSYEVERITGFKPEIVNSAQDTITLAIPSTVSVDELESSLSLYGYTADVTPSGNVNQVTIWVDDTTATKLFLERVTGSEITPFEENGEVLYEIRSKISQEELSSLVSPIGTVVSYREGVTRNTLELTKRVLDEKLNALGLKDIKTRTVGGEYILIDMAGEENLTRAERIVTTPGKFEVKFYINGQYIPLFTGEGIESVGQVVYDEQRGWGVEFRIDRESADRLRDTAIKYGVLENPSNYPLVMFLDEREIFNATISPELADTLRYEPVRNLVATTGFGSDAEQTARDLQIHLRVGALPVKVDVIGAGQVPAALGSQFKKQSVIAGLLVLLGVVFVVFIRYRQSRILLPMIGTSISEVIIILGFASLIKWELDLASIAGIIATIGTGVDHLVIITDEVLSGGRMPTTKLYMQRLGRAFAIILAAASTVLIAMSSLFFIAFGALKGFALITIVGVLIGVLIARPAYGRIIKDLIK